MIDLFVSPEAENDLDEIEEFIGKDNPVAASKFVVKLSATFQRLADAPGIGRKRDEILPGLRSLAHRPYVILYLADGKTITIVRVLHGSRDIDALFGSLR